MLEDRLTELEESLAGWTRLTVAEGLAQQNLDDAKAELFHIEKGLDPLEVAQQKAVVDLAQIELQTAIDDLQAQETGEGASRRKQLAAALVLAQERQSRAAAELIELEAGPNSVQSRQLAEKVESSSRRGRPDSL